MKTASKESNRSSYPGHMQEVGFHGMIALFALTLQNAALVISMKLSFRPEARPYSAPVVVLCVECLKLVSCCSILRASEGPNSLKSSIHSSLHSAKLAIPSLLYVVQNSLLLVAVQHLSQTAFIVASQGKIITSAVFSVLLLQKRFTRHQLLALCILALGIVLVQLQVDVSQKSTNLKGVCTMLAANLTSGYAGVFLERLFKSSQTDSIWLRNIQLCVFSIPIAAASVFLDLRSHSSTMKLLYVFDGFDSVVLLVITLNAIGGLISAFVMRYASAVLKCFAVSFSICLCTIVDLLDGHVPSARIVTGILLVSISVFVYATKA